MFPWDAFLFLCPELKRIMPYFWGRIFKLNKKFQVMKKMTLMFALIGCLSLGVQAQRIACVDVNQILESMAEYKAAQEEVDKSAAQWKQQLDQMQDQIKGLYNKYQSEIVLLSEEAKRQREDEIMEKERQMIEFSKSKFGPEGSLFKKRQELIRPLQDKVYAAIEEFAEQKGFDFIFDKGGSAGMLFSNPRYDKTSDVIKKLKG